MVDMMVDMFLHILVDMMVDILFDILHSPLLNFSLPLSVRFSILSLFFNPFNFDHRLELRPTVVNYSSPSSS